MWAVAAQDQLLAGSLLFGRIFAGEGQAFFMQGLPELIDRFGSDTVQLSKFTFANFRQLFKACEASLVDCTAGRR